MPNAPERLVINTGPLISLGRAGAFEILQDLPLQFITPAEVAEELAAGARIGRPITIPNWVEVVSLARRPSAPLVQSLDQGEAAVISLALELEVPTVAIDEWRGRRVARALGLEVTGSLGLLGRAKTAGAIPQLRPWVERLFAAGARLETALVQQFLRAFGEE